MASTLVTALDTHTPRQVGENGHVEYAWSNDLREKIVQLSFQITRTDDAGVKSLGDIFYSIALPLKNILDSNSPISEMSGAGATATASSSPTSSSIYKFHEAEEMLDTLRRMVISTRDIECGKGEWAIGRELVRQWYRIYPDEALKMIKYFVHPLPVSESQHPYGSWKDIKFLWRVFGGEHAPSEVVAFIVNLINTQLKADIVSHNPSLCPRWVPRENASKKSPMPFRPLYHALAEDYFSNYLATARTPEATIRAKRKAYTHYRDQILTPLNARLDTVQIKQCGKTWSEIDYGKHVTSVTMRKQTKAFMNKNPKGDQRSSDPDRIKAAENFEAFVNSAKESGATIKGKRVGINTFIADAWGYLGKNDQTQIDVLDLQWKNAGETIGDLGEFVAMVDLSGSMGGDPMMAAIGLGLRVAEKSALGPRVMTFSTSPQWINLEGANTLSDMISIMKPYTSGQYWGGSTNFTAALKLILDKVVEIKMPAEDVANIKLIIFSDMQIDSYGNESVNDTMWERIVRMYADAGRRAIGTPYTPGHIVFWNLRHTSGTPVLSTTKNTTMFAGFSPALLNTFVEKGLEAFQSASPWSMLREQLANPRYNIMDFH